MGETVGLEDDGAQLGDGAAAPVVEVHEWKAGAGHGVFEESDRRSDRETMLAA
jgi:hypothetical protein